MASLGISGASKAPNGNWYLKMKDGRTVYATLAQLKAAQDGREVI